MRIEQSHTFLLDLARQAGSGHLGVAAFQRPYVWTRDDVEAYFASILKGWPTGSFMIWDTAGTGGAETLSRGRLGPIATQADAPLVLLDGQNRLATFAWSMAPESIDTTLGYAPAERDTWLSGDVLTIDIEAKRIVFMDPDQASEGLRLPFALVARPLLGGRTNFDVVKTLSDRGASNDAINWAFDTVPNTIRSARTVATTVSRATIEEAKGAFLSICRVGQPITEEDFDRAMAWSPPASPVSGMGA